MAALRGRATSRVALVVVPLVVFGALAGAVAVGATVPGDRTVYDFLEPYKDAHSVRYVANVLSGRAIELAAIAVTAATCLVLAVRCRFATAVLVGGSLGALLLAQILKDAFDRMPPPIPYASPHMRGPSFPSGHATLSMALAAVVLIVVRGWGRLAVAVAGLLVVTAVGVAAVIAGGHWPSDVVAGWSLALAWVNVLGLLTAARRRTA